MFRLRVLTGFAADWIAFGELPLSSGSSLVEWREAVEVLQKVKIFREHFNLALRRYFQDEKVLVCPQVCPHSHVMHERTRMEIPDKVPHWI